MAFVDTNILLRWLLNDHIALSLKARQLIDSAKPNSLVITDMIAAEVVYVLGSTGRSRSVIADALVLLAGTPAFRYANPEIMHEIVGLLVKTKLDFADCYLAARARRENMELKTFDKALLKQYEL